MMLKRATPWATLIIASFVILLLYAFLKLIAIQSELRGEIGEANLWAATQAEREAQQFLLALAGGFADAQDNDAGLRFEILYSRVALLAEGPQFAYFRQIGADPFVLQARQVLEDMDAQLQGLGSDAQGPIAGKAAMLAGLMRDLATTTNLHERAERLERRDDLAAAMQLLLVAVLGVFVTGAAMAALLLRNMRQLMRTRAELERHQAGLEITIAARTAELRDALQVERRAREVYRSFIVTVSHQFRTPVSIIHMIAQRQIRSADDALPAAVRRKFDHILAAAERLERLLGSFLASATAESGGLVSQRRERLDFNAITGAALGQIRVAFPGRTIHADLAAGPMPLDGDPVLLEQVILNILANAVKYSSPPAPVEVTTRAEGGRLLCSVRDHGAGIPAEAQPAIFERFYRAPNVHRLPGVGVGLSLARDIVQQYGGKITFTSQEGVGSTFTVALPAAGGAQHD